MARIGQYRKHTRRGRRPVKSQLSAKPIYYNEAGTFAVRRLLARRNRVMYQVEYEGQYPTEWVHESNITPDLVQAFQQRTAVVEPPTNLKQATAAYDESTLSLRPGKVEANRLWAAAARSVATQPGTLAYLDSPSMNTTRWMLKHHVPLGSAHWWALNFHSDAVQHMRLLGLQEVAQVNCSHLGDFIVRPDLPPFVGLWADYCCTWQGTDHCRPQQDIKRLFQGRRLASNSVLAVTLCLRDRRAVGVKYSTTCRCIHAFFRYHANAHGYQLQRLSTLLYGNMYFFVYKCRAR